MIKKFLTGKTAVFIDASNVYFSQKTLKWHIDFVRLLEYLKNETDFWKAFFYTAHDPDHKKQKEFLDFLEIVGYSVRTKKVKFIRDKTSGGFHKGNLDVELTIDAVHSQGLYKSFLLFSGDSDFEALIKYLKQHGKRCVVFSVKGHIAIELLKQAKFVDLKKLEPYVKKK